MSNVSKWPKTTLGEVLDPVSRPEPVSPDGIYRILGAHWYAHGLYTKDTLTGAEIQAPKVYRVVKGDFVYNRLFAWKGSFAVATQENHGCYVSNEFPCFRVKSERLDAHFLKYYFSRETSWTEALGLSSGGTPTSRNRLKEEVFLQLQIPLPPLAEQRRLVERIDALAAKIEEAKRLRAEALYRSTALGNAQALWNSPRKTDGQLRAFVVFEQRGGDIPQRTVSPLAVVEHFDVFEEAQLRFRSRRVLDVMHQLLLQARKE